MAQKVIPCPKCGERLDVRIPASILLMDVVVDEKSGEITDKGDGVVGIHEQENPFFVCSGNCNFTRPMSAEELASFSFATTSIKKSV